jgi:phenylacetate-CoA ligase
MGTWVGGLYTLDCCRHLALKGLKVFTVAPGSNLNEILRIVGELSPKFEQTVLLGYPPFLKDVIDEGVSRQVPWSDYHVRWVCAGEVFSEEWRALVASRLGTPDDCTSSASIYGTADAGVLACETPLSITIRRWLANQPEAAMRLFGESRLPALLQYDPYHRYFECIHGELLFTGDNGVPLVRYNIHDTGGIMEYDEMLAHLQGYGFDALTSHSLFNLPVRRLPFVWVFGRSNFTISYYGANIYPENVTVALEQEPLCNWVTGKFVMHVGHDTDENSSWMVEIELAQEAEATPDKVVEIQYAIQSQLIRLNSEFAHYVPSAAKLPAVNLHPYHEATWFPAGVKHRYTRR